MTHLEKISLAVHCKTGVPIVMAQGRKVDLNQSRARFMVWWIARKVTELSFPQIAKEFGCRHQNVVHGVQWVDNELEANPKLWKRMKSLVKKCA